MRGEKLRVRVCVRERVVCERVAWERCGRVVREGEVGESLACGRAACEEVVCDKSFACQICGCKKVAQKSILPIPWNSVMGKGPFWHHRQCRWTDRADRHGNRLSATGTQQTPVVASLQVE